MFSRDAVIASLADGLTSFYAGFVVFCVVGFMAHEANIPIDQMSLQGTRLSFVSGLFYIIIICSPR